MEEDGWRQRKVGDKVEEKKRDGLDKHRSKHKHHKHHHKRSGSKERERRRSRSRSKERDRERDRHGDRDRDNRREDKNERKRDNYRNKRSRSRSKSPSSRKRERTEDRRKEELDKSSKVTEHVTSNSEDDEELDLGKVVQPFVSGGIPPAATKLKAEIERRKQLWSKKETPGEASAWKQTAFSGDNDGRMSAKFKRLMGIKGGGPSTSTSDDGKGTSSEKPEEGDRQEYFANLEKQYEVARAATHTQRGLGLGFSSRLFPG